jgi:transcriptional regulator with XRE-family HTH domain
MQALFPEQSELFETGGYAGGMARKERPPLGQRLTELRQAAGLTQTQLAGRIGVHPSNVGFWELSGTPPRGEVLPKMAEVLGVSIDALLGIIPPKPKKQAAKGRLQLVFESASKLPRRQQQKIAEVVEALVNQLANTNSNA